jgi:hypothetical protein
MLEGGVSQLLDSARALGDTALLNQLAAQAARGRAATAALVAHVAEVEARDLHLRLGYTSLFVYGRDALALSEHDAYRVVAAARAARRFPVILEMLARGAIHLTTLRLVAPHLTPDNHRQVLEAVRGKKRRQVEEIVARLVPQPDVPASLERLLSPGVAPTGADRYKVQLAVGADVVEKLRLAKDMLRHALPRGDDAAILDRALVALLADLAKRKFAATDRPRPSRDAEPGGRSRHVPAEVKRAVWLRDLGRCAFIGTTGERCGERAFLEFHHLEPYATGGEATERNIELRCRRHNDYEARSCLGRGIA